MCVRVCVFATPPGVGLSVFWISVDAAGCAAAALKVIKCNLRKLIRNYF